MDLILISVWIFCMPFLRLWLRLGLQSESLIFLSVHLLWKSGPSCVSRWFLLFVAKLKRNFDGKQVLYLFFHIDNMQNCPWGFEYIYILSQLTLMGHMWYFFFFSEQIHSNLQNIQCLNRSHYISYTKSLFFIYRGLDFFSLSCNIKIGRHTQGWHGFDKKLMICTSL